MRDTRVVTLLSNESMDLYPDNTVCRFRNALQLDLDPMKRYECCLRSMSFVRSWPNFFPGVDYTITYRSAAAAGESSPLPDVVRTVAPGYYRKEDFERSVRNERMQTRRVSKSDVSTGAVNLHRSECRLIWVDAIQKFRVVFDGGRLLADHTNALMYKRINLSRFKSDMEHTYDTVTLSPALAQKCGFGDGSAERVFVWDKTNAQTQTHDSDFAVHFDPIDCFHLQCSLVQSDHHVGLGKYPILDLIPLASPGSYGARQTYTPAENTFFDVNTAEAQFPRVLITDLAGNLVPFDFGIASVTLLLREKRDE